MSEEHKSVFVLTTGCYCLSCTRSHLCLLHWTGAVLWESLLVPGPSPWPKSGHYLLFYEVLLKLFHVEMSYPAILGYLLDTHFHLRDLLDVPLITQIIGDTAPSCEAWEITVDNSGVLTFPDVWHIPPGWAGILFLDNDKSVSRALRRKELLWVTDSPLLSSPLLPPVQSECVHTVHYRGWSLALCPSYILWFLKDVPS